MLEYAEIGWSGAGVDYITLEYAEICWIDCNRLI